mmetsp:Transcript_806/g.1422  ORF Transcript_806/g.1422 Transcript_806/m.1422 type:complete len:184 (+) Transcript_806:229-780(+)
MDFSLIPWGNAYYNTSACGGKHGYNKTRMYCWIKECGVDKPPADCFTSPVLCQHGPNECLANRIEAFAVSYSNETIAALFTICFEALFDPSWMNGTKRDVYNAASQCAVKFHISQTSLIGCAKGDQGAKLEKEMAEKTAKYGVNREGTPWVVVNGQVLKDSNKELLPAICKNYTGTKPPGCKM